ncbi:MAG: serine/threonine protein kinase, partial [Kofleriaceae bacterium]|nr:serine/threonine protein kinase [Kofleriaceae bacterium]
MRDHLDDDLLSLYAVGAATPAECLVADGHLVQCDDCRELVAELARGNREGSPSSLGDPLCGLTIGRYLLEERLGAGAHSVVYRAHDPILERKVALKLVREIDDGPLRKQLIRAAQAMAQIDHRNVLAIYDAGEDGNEVFVTSAIAENGDLRTFLESKPSVKRLLSGFAELAEGLSAVHRSGLTHRDIKPDNILVDGDANFLLADIGHTPQVGALGSVTPAYLAPEVRDGRPFAASADQYAFALTVCEVLTGVRPKNTDDAARVLRNKRVPTLAIKTILRALDPEPEKRFDDAADIAIGLRPRWKSWHVVASGGAVLSAITIILFATTMIGAGSQPVCARSVDAAVSQWQAVRPVLAERFSTRESLWTPIDAHPGQFFVTL